MTIEPDQSTPGAEHWIAGSTLKVGRSRWPVTSITAIIIVKHRSRRRGSLVQMIGAHRWVSGTQVIGVCESSSGDLDFDLTDLQESCRILLHRLRRFLIWIFRSREERDPAELLTHGINAKSAFQLSKRMFPRLDLRKSVMLCGDSRSERSTRCVEAASATY